VPSLTGGEIVARTLTNYGVKYAAGIPGHGVWALLDGFLRDESDVAVLQVFHEQSMTSGGHSSMGWAVPAAIGAKLAQPDRQVACVVGDGDFLQTGQELGVCAQHEIPVVFVVQNNGGYMSIRGGQRKITNRHLLSEFSHNGEPYEVDITTVARGFGVEAFKVEESDDLQPALERAFASEDPALVEVPTSRDAAGPWVPGWWDFPVPAYIEDERQSEYWANREEEQHQ
jgi:acetolactate synthase-1/2/3 large subunit